MLQSHSSAKFLPVAKRHGQRLLRVVQFQGRRHFWFGLSLDSDFRNLEQFQQIEQIEKFLARK